MLISYVKDNTGYILATIVGLSADKVGVAIRSPKEKRCQKKLGVRVATARAERGISPRFPDRTILNKFYEPTLLSAEVEKKVLAMRERCTKYFKSSQQYSQQ